MIITISGDIGSGKSTVAKIIAKKMGLKHYSVGDFMRQLAHNQGISFEELTRKSFNDPQIDYKLDSFTQDLAHRREHNFIIDGRIAWHFLPESVKVFLKVSPDVSAKRILLRKHRDENFTSIEAAHRARIERRRIENDRYRKIYHIDMENPSNYDLVISTDTRSAEEVADAIIAFCRERTLSLR